LRKNFLHDLLALCQGSLRAKFGVGSARELFLNLGLNDRVGKKFSRDS